MSETVFDVLDALLDDWSAIVKYHQCCSQGEEDSVDEEEERYRVRFREALERKER